MCQHRSLYKSDGLHIGQCRQCNKISIQYLNLMFNFSKSAYFQFTEEISALNFKDHAYRLQGQQARIVLRTADQNFSYHLTETELHDLQQACQQAKLLVEAQTLIASA